MTNSVLPHYGIQPGELVGDRIEIRQMIGSGGMGAVFEGCHRHTGRRGALEVRTGSLSAGHREVARR